MTGNGGGPMPLAKPAVRWSYVAGKRHSVLTQVEDADSALSKRAVPWSSESPRSSEPVWNQ